MITLVNQFIVTASTTIFALLVFHFYKYILSEKPSNVIYFDFIKPLDALSADLGRVFEDVNSRLPRNRKTNCFPMLFDIGIHTNTYCKKEDLIEIVSAQLELAGWVVTKTADCSETEIILDIPRKEFL